jgi:hypothetical protein
MHQRHATEIGRSDRSRQVANYSTAESDYRVAPLCSVRGQPSECSTQAFERFSRLTGWQNKGIRLDTSFSERCQDWVGVVLRDLIVGY